MRWPEFDVKMLWVVLAPQVGFGLGAETVNQRFDLTPMSEAKERNSKEGSKKETGNNRPNGITRPNIDKPFHAFTETINKCTSAPSILLMTQIQKMEHVVTSA